MTTDRCRDCGTIHKVERCADACAHGSTTTDDGVTWECLICGADVSDVVEARR